MAAPENRPAATVRRGRAYWLRLAVLFVIGLPAALYLVWPVVLANQFTRPARVPLNGISPADAGLAYQDITLTASDGVRIASWYVPSENGVAIVLVHGILGNRAGVLPVAAMLAKHGYGLLMIDMRAHGESGGDAWASWLAERDVLAGVDFLKARPEVMPGRVAVWGFSAGAQTVILAAARTGDIGAVAADAPGWTQLKDEPFGSYSVKKLLLAPQDWVYITVVEQVYTRGNGTPTAVIDDIAAIAPRPLLLIVGGENPNEVHFAQNYLAHAGEPKQLWLIPDARHGDKWARHPGEYEAHLIEFFDGWLNDR